VFAHTKRRKREGKEREKRKEREKGGKTRDDYRVE